MNTLYDLKDTEFLFKNYYEVERALTRIENYENKVTKHNFLLYFKYYDRVKKLYRFDGTNYSTNSYKSLFYNSYLLSLVIYNSDNKQFNNKLMKIYYMYLNKTIIELEDIYNIYQEYNNFFEPDEFNFYDMLETIMEKKNIDNHQNYYFYISRSYEFYKTIELNLKMIYFLTKDIKYMDDDPYSDDLTDFIKRGIACQFNNQQSLSLNTQEPYNYCLSKNGIEIIKVINAYSFIRKPRTIFQHYNSKSKFYDTLHSYLNKLNYDFEKDIFYLSQFTNEKLEFKEVKNFLKIINEEYKVQSSINFLKSVSFQIINNNSEKDYLNFTEEQKEIYYKYIQLLTEFLSIR
jgi:hypothetical protein